MTSTSIELIGFAPATGALHFFGQDVHMKFSDGVSKAHIISRNKFTTLFVSARTSQERKIESLALRVIGRERYEIKLPQLRKAEVAKQGLQQDAVWHGQEGLPEPRAGAAWHLVLTTSPIA